MRTEGRFNSSLLKSSGWSWETKAGTHIVGNNEGDAPRLHISRADSTWSPTIAEKPSLRHSSSICSFMVVNGAIIIVVEPWKDVLQWQKAHLVHHQRKLPSSRSWLVSSMGRVLPMPVGRQERMWCLSSLSTAAPVTSACNNHNFNDFW